MSKIYINNFKFGLIEYLSSIKPIKKKIKKKKKRKKSKSHFCFQNN